MSRGQRSSVVMTDIGPQKQCTKCDEFWSDDAEFFYLRGGKTTQPCKACYEAMPSVIAKRARQRKQAQPQPGAGA